MVSSAIAVFFAVAAGLYGADLQPQLAAAHGKVALAWGSGSAIWFAVSPDGGANFAPRVKVADTGVLALGRHRGPRVTILPDAILVTAIAGQDLLAWRSVDQGSTWVRAATINDVPGASREGLHSIAADASGRNLFAVWLDLRAKNTQLYGARSTDGGRTWSKNELLYASPDGTICQCCDPSVAIDDHGQIAVMFRNALAGSRDLYLTRSADGVHFDTQKLGEGTWKLDACPMDGGGLAFDHGQIVTAWRRGTEIFLDRPGASENSLGEGRDVAIAAGSKGTYVAFPGPHGIMVLSPGEKAPVKISDYGAFPALTTLPDGSALAAWEENGAIRVQKLP